MLAGHAWGHSAGPIIEQRLTPAQYAALPEDEQRNIARAHFIDLIDQAEVTGAIGSTIRGTTVTLSGLVAVAHRGGAAGMRKFVQTRGEYNPADQLGTSLSDYLSRHGSGEMREFMSPDEKLHSAQALLTQARDRAALDVYE